MQLISYTKWVALYCIPVIIITASCKKNTPSTPIPAEEINKQLIKIALVEKVSISEIKERAAPLMRGNRIQRQIVNALCTRPVKIYRLTYTTTTPDHKETDASGLLAIPDDPSARYPMLSYQHPTILDPRMAPSVYSPHGWDYVLLPLVASNGYITVAADYLGYGVSEDKLPHPYMHHTSLATAVNDLLLAVEPWLQAQAPVKWNQQLFLAGYSEGGYATMAALKALQEEKKYRNKFRIIAASCGAGPYSISFTADTVLKTDKDLGPLATNLYARVITSYNSLYNINSPLSNIFLSPYDQEVTKPPAESSMALNPTLLFTRAFLDSIRRQADLRFMAAFRANDIYQWVPEMQVLLFTGTKDQDVHPYNTTLASRYMSAKGGRVTKFVTNKDHEAAMPDFVFQTFSFFTAHTER